jgi:hypothetical protein
VNSSLSSLKFESNLNVVADLSLPNEGVYRIIVRPFRQTITVSMAGFRQARFTIPASQPRAVMYYTVEPVKSDSETLIPVTLRVNQSDAAVFIDGQQVDITKTIPIESGTHQIRIEKIGFQTIDQPIQISSESPFHEFTMQRLIQRRVVIRSTPAGARIRINGIERSEPTPVDFFLFPGEYGLELNLPGYRSLFVPMNVVNDVGNDFSFALNRISGDLTLSITPSNARVFVDELEVTGERVIPLDPGDHTLRVQASGHDVYQTRFEMKEGTPLSLSVALRPHTGSVRFTIRPIEVQTVLYNPDGSIAKEWSGSNILENLPVGRYRYVMRLQGSADHTGEVDITRDDEQLVSHSFGGASVSNVATTPVVAPAPAPTTRATLLLEADVDAEIIVSGQSYGRKRVSVPLDPGVYTVVFRHPLKTETITVQMPATGVVARQVTLRPSKAPAVLSSLLLPGSGLISTQRPRGFIYLAGFAGASYYAWMQSGIFDESIRDHEALLNLYNGSSITSIVVQNRVEAESARLRANKAAEQITIGLAAAAGIYVLQFLDVGLSTPKYGYRGTSQPIQFSLAPTGFQLTYRFN